MKAKILLRRGTAQEWAQKNPVLGRGEPGVETDTNRIKLGNGVSAWNALPYETPDSTGGGGGSTNPDFVFSNSNGVTFGTNGSTVTASVQTNYQSAGAYLTTAMKSDAATLSNINVSVPGSSVLASGFVFSNNGNVTFGLNGNTLSASAPAAGGGGSINFSAGATSNNLSAITFNNGSGVTFGLTGSTMTASVKTDYQSSGAYLTTAMQSNAATLSNVKVSAGLSSSNVSAFTFSNGSGVSWGYDGTNITATVATNYQSQGAYLTTAALSQDSSKYAGINGAITGGSITVNTSGISVNLPAYLTTADLSQNSSKYAGINSGATNCSVTVNTSGVSVALPNYLTTAALSQDSSKYAGINGAITGGSITVNTSGVSVNLPAYLTTADLSQNSSKYAGINSGATNCSVTVNTSGVSVNVGNYITTGALSSQTLVFSLGGNSATTNSSQISNGGYVIAGGNSLTIQQSNNTISFSVGNYITTADLSQNSSKYAGINGAITGGSITVNTSGVSVNLPAYLTTAMQSNAATISAVKISAGASSSNVSAITFSNANNVSFGYDGTNITASIVQATASTFKAGGTNSGNTAGTTGFADQNLVFVGTGAISLSQSMDAGSHSATITLSVPQNVTASYWGNVECLANMVTGASAVTQTSGASIFVQPFFLPYAASVGYVRFLASYNDSAVGTAGTTQANTSFSCDRYSTFGLVLYSQGVGANSRSIQSVGNTTQGMTGRTIYSAGGTGSQYTVTIQKTYPVSNATSQYTSSYAVSSSSIVISSNSNTLFTGARFLDVPWATSLGPGNYWIGLGCSTSSNSNSSNISFAGTAALPMSIAGVSQSNVSVAPLGAATSASDNQLQIGLGVWTTNASLVSTGSIGLNSISQVVSNPIVPFWLIRQA